MIRVSRKRIVLLIISITAILVLVLGAWWLSRPLGPGPMVLRPVAFSDLPHWQNADPRGALNAFRRSCVKIAAKDPNDDMGGAGYAGSAMDWQTICADLPGAKTPRQARQIFEARFTPVVIRSGAIRDGLFTGYYEPEILGSRTRHGTYQTPVYGLPADLISVDLGAFRDSLKHEHIAGRIEGQRLVPYATRAKIVADGLKTAKVLFYAADPVAVFFLQIQGSGRVQFDDGSYGRVAYAGTNGHIYTAIGRTLIKQGALTRDNVSLQSIAAWLKAHPDGARAVMDSNKSYVFFQNEPIVDAKLGAKGAEGVPLTPRASLAVDRRLHPLGAPFFVAGTAPDPSDPHGDVPFDTLLIAQDTGGAIRGAVRGDVFWGFGKTAETIAGRMKAHGQLYVLLPKIVAARLGSGKEFADTAP